MAKQWTKDLSHADKLQSGSDECLHPLCAACRDELYYQELHGIRKALELLIEVTINAKAST